MSSANKERIDASELHRLGLNIAGRSDLDRKHLDTSAEEILPLGLPGRELLHRAKGQCGVKACKETRP